MNLYKRKGPINPNRFKYRVNQDFFKKWSCQMVYILGFTFADGNIHYCSLSWDLKNDIVLLKKINKAMGSNYPIKRREKSVKLRISNPIILQDIQALGVKPNKTKICLFPDIPERFLRDFIRGFLDGDGWITAKKRKMEISVGFSNGSYKFLKRLADNFNQILSLPTHNLRKRIKITKNKKTSTTFMIEYYSENAYKIIRYLYDGLKKDDLFLTRKYQKQLEARKIYEELKRGPKLWRRVEKKHDMPMYKLLNTLYYQDSLDVVKMAQKLGVHPSSIRRWLEKTGIRSPMKKERKIVFTNCLICGKEIQQYHKLLIKYCSIRCRLKARQTGKTIKCLNCGKKIYRAQWWSKINNKAFCSRRCLAQWRLDNNLLSRSKINGQFLISSNK